MARKVLMISTAIVIVLVVIMESASLRAKAGSDLQASVQIYNKLPDLMYVHCGSEQREFKSTILQENAGHFGWEFYPKVWWGRTEFYCNFKWVAKRRWQNFVVWTEQYQQCVDCVWVVRPNGFWLFHEIANAQILVHPWLECVASGKPDLCKAG